MSRATSLAELKRELGAQLTEADQVQPPPGLSTGWSKLDQYLLWRGFPVGEVSLLVSEAGGATTLWQQCAAQVTQQQKWVAWLNGPLTQLTPWSLRHRGVDLSRFIYVAQPTDIKQTLWALQELMSLSLFELVGCDLGNVWLKEHQVLQLRKLSLRYQTGLVLFTASPEARVFKSSFYALILQFLNNHVNVYRAQHRPTPYALERRDLYADTLPQLAAGRRALCG